MTLVPGVREGVRSLRGAASARANDYDVEWSAARRLP